jgi:hypothetical protein
MGANLGSLGPYRRKSVINHKMKTQTVFISESLRDLAN